MDDENVPLTNAKDAAQNKSSQVVGYQSFTELSDSSENPHMFIHVANSGQLVNSWQSYLRDLDDFFESIYNYHQKSGFWCIVLQHITKLIEIFFVVSFTLFLAHGLDYQVMFKNKLPPGYNDTKPFKITISQILIPLNEATLSPWEILPLLFVTAFWFIKIGLAIKSIRKNWAIRMFFNDVLQVHDSTLYTWQEIQTRLINNQSLFRMRDGHLDELAIHHRLLRKTNFMIALINKGVLPLSYKLPFLKTELYYLTSGLEFNFDLLLFRGYLSLFEKNWKLREEVKSPFQRHECAKKFRNRCLLLGILNVLFFPFIFVWNVLYTLYAYTEALKRDPSVLSSRTWSCYGRWYCRHFNEMEHELDQRLNRAHIYASRYMNLFNSPQLVILANFFKFTSSVVLSVILILTIYDEDVITIEHFLTIVAALSFIVACSVSVLPSSEPMRWTAAELDEAILQHIHYRPHNYPAHTLQARNSMSHMFVYKLTTILEELISPLITPLILIRHLRPKALEIVDFFRVYTLELADIGDVCTFAHLNFQQHGNRAVKDQMNAGDNAGDSTSHARPFPILVDERQTTRNGKLELSLINFKLQNPRWQPQSNSQAEFIDRFTKEEHFPALLETDMTSSSTYWRPLRASTNNDQASSQMQRSNAGYEHLPRDENGYDVSRVRTARPRVLSTNEQQARDRQMALSSLYFHQIVNNDDRVQQTNETVIQTPSHLD